MSTEDVSNVKLEAKITEINETESLINEEDTKNTLPRSSSKSPSLVKKDSSSCLQKKKVKHFYERQNSLLEKYEDDSKIVNVRFEFLVLHIWIFIGSRKKSIIRQNSTC